MIMTAMRELTLPLVVVMIKKSWIVCSTAFANLVKDSRSSSALRSRRIKFRFLCLFSSLSLHSAESLSSFLYIANWSTRSDQRVLEDATYTAKLPTSLRTSLGTSAAVFAYIGNKTSCRLSSRHCRASRASALPNVN